MCHTIRRTRCSPNARHLGGALFALVLLLTSLAPEPAGAQEAWRTHFAAGEEGRREGEADVYAREMALAVDAMEPGMLNRPFAEYHAARAHALAGRPDEAVAYLRLMWEEDIEALMTSFAAHDPAFDAMRDREAFRAVMARPATMRVELRLLDGAVHLLEGAGANVLASVGEDGVLLVDTGYGAALPAVRRALARAAGLEGGAGPGRPMVEALILTHPHEDHWGGAAELGPEAVVLAHPGTAEAMDEPLVFMEGVELPPKPERARPNRTTRDTTFVFNGEEVRVFGVEAHTGADLAVHFTGSRVLALGDAWLAQNPMMFPGGAEPDAFLDRLAGILEALPPGTVVVGGHDPPTDPAAVLAQIETTRGCMARVRRALDEGLELEATTAGADEACPAPWLAYFHRALAG